MPRANPNRQEVLAAAGKTEADLPTAAEFDGELPEDLEFEPVLHTHPRADSVTPERQRIFIAMLAACGSVKTAATALGFGEAPFHRLRHRPGAESFSNAWDKAVARGARRILDVLVDQSINGVPEYIYKDGVIVAERRHFNTRAMMWIVAHYMPERFGVTGGLMHASGTPVNMKRQRDRWRDEWNREQLEERRVRSEKLREDNRRGWHAIREGFKRNLKADPQKRKAWELLTGATDWGDLSKLPNYAGLPEMNYNRPDMVVTMAAVDYPNCIDELKAEEGGGSGEDE